MAQTIEAVIISEPRRGEIIRLPVEEPEEVSDEDIQMLNEALDGLIAAIDRVSAKVRTMTEDLKRIGEA
jgi:hypothetical protein